MLKYSCVCALVFSCIAASSPAAAAQFSGPRVEIRGGWDRTTLSVDDAVDSVSGSDHSSGWDAGVEIGYDAALGKSLIAGAYAGVEFANTKECGEVYGNDSLCLKLGRNFTLGGRLGVKVSPKVMLYAKAGYSNGQLRAVYRNSDDPSLNGEAHSNRGGLHFGAGGEASVGTNRYVRLEYVRTEYDAYSDPDLGGSVDGHRDQVLAGFGLRF
jgi:outer membrane immunogenic protein